MGKFIESIGASIIGIIFTVTLVTCNAGADQPLELEGADMQEIPVEEVTVVEVDEALEVNPGIVILPGAIFEIDEDNTRIISGTIIVGEDEEVGDDPVIVGLRVEPHFETVGNSFFTGTGPNRVERQRYRSEAADRVDCTGLATVTCNTQAWAKFNPQLETFLADMADEGWTLVDPPGETLFLSNGKKGMQFTLERSAILDTNTNTSTSTNTGTITNTGTVISTATG